MYTIGEVAKIKGLTIKALRFYEKIGLLLPKFIDPINNYRYYDKDQFVYIDIIKAARSLDISPKSLVKLMEQRDTKTLMNEVTLQKKAIVKKISELSLLLEQAKAIENTYEASISSSKSHDVYTKQLSKRYIVYKMVEPNILPESLDCCYDDLNRQIGISNLISTYESGILLKNTKKGYMPHKAFIVVTSHLNTPVNLCEIISAGQYICVNYTQATIYKQQKN